MSAATDTAQAIADPASASSDGQSVTARPGGDLIALLYFQAMLENMNNRRPFRQRKMTNPGAVDDGGRVGVVTPGFNGLW